MHTSIHRLLRVGALLVLTVALLGAGALGRAGRATAAPAAATLPAATCTLAGSTRSCDLWAKTGTLSLPGLSTPPTIWGYAASAADPAGLPGPTLIVNQGETVQVTLHNTLPQASSLSFLGQALPPDTTGAAAGSLAAPTTKTYSFVASAPGTYLYEAGLTANGSRQVAMGLYGALIVRPATAGQAYGSPSSAYNDEALLVLSEIDTNLNAAPSTFKMYNYNPNFWLINGKAFPNTAPIDTAAGNKVLLRYVNAGLQPRAIGLLGLRQTVLAADGDLLPYARTVIAETMGAGQTLDAVAAIPAGAVAGTKYALYNTNGQPRNASQRTGGVLNFGGMLTFLTVGTGATPTDTAGPATSGVSVAPSPTNGSVSVTLSATVSDQSTGGANVSAAEYFVDAVGANASGVAMGGTFGGPSASVSASVSTATLATLSSGNHTLYVHGRDSLGNWGPVSSAVLNLDKAGPAISAAALSPAYSNGTASVGIQATASDAASGNGNVVAAEYSLNGGPALAMTVNQAAPIASLTATIPAATVSTLAAGSYPVTVRAQDALGNWGAVTTLSLVVDKTGPATSAVSVSPNPNNGTTGYNSSVGAVRLFATFSDGTTPIATGEGFIDTLGAPGAGFPLLPTDGLFNGSTEGAYADISLPNISLLTNGNHTFYVRGKDAAGNWGATATTVLLVDKTAPTFTSAAAVAPNPTLGATSVTLTATATDPANGAAAASNIVAAEYYIDTDPGIGGATALTVAAPAPTLNVNASINVSALAVGPHTLGLRVRDAANNWSLASTVSFSVLPDAIFADGFEAPTTLPGNWTIRSTSTTSRLNNTTAAALVGARGLQAQGNNTNYVQYNFGSTANPATSTYDARFYFNPNNNASTGQDIFAAATTTNFNSTLFRVRYRRNGSQPQVQIQVNNTANATWINITNNASNRIEVVWQSGSSLRLYVNGILAQTLTTSSTGSVVTVRLGSVTSGSSSTLEYFDAFASKRSVATLIGP